MNNVLIRLIAILAPVIFFVVGSACDKSQQGDKKGVSKQDIEISFTTERLPIGFKGDDIERAYDKLKSKKPEEKTEFETTEQYKKNIEANYNSLIKDNTIWCFQGSKMYYDADDRKYWIYLKMENGHNLPEPPMHLWLRKNIVKKNYIGQNAFGATLPITLHEEIQYYIIPLNKSEISKKDAKAEKLQEGGYGCSYKMKIELPMSPDKAKQYSLHVLVLCRPRPYGSPINYRFVTENEWRKPPTFDSPVDWQGRNYFIYAELLGVWIYDMNSGEIIAKYKPLFEYDESIGFEKGKKIEGE